ncbi:UbiA family prenyltransferase [Myceligenerans cantabricum]
MTPRDLAELTRAPGILTTLGDPLTGMAAARVPVTPRRLALPVASACLYAGGMVLNDWSDRDVDAIERPERPIPSGRVSPRAALGLGAALTAAGVAAAAVGGGRRAFGVASALAACVWTYDTLVKDSVAGPVAMAACRGLDVLLGASSGRIAAGLPAASTIAAHTLGVTVLSRGEVHGTTTRTAALTAAGTLTVTAATIAVTLAAHPRPATSVATGLGLAGSAAYAAACLPAQVRAAQVPTGPAAREATKSGIGAMVPLQAAWSAGAGAAGTALFLAGVTAVGRLLARRRSGVSVT